MSPMILTFLHHDYKTPNKEFKSIVHLLQTRNFGDLFTFTKQDIPVIFSSIANKVSCGLDLEH